MSMPIPSSHSQTVPTVSVIIPAHNYGRFLSEAIDSALGQTAPPFEVIVIDVASTDGTAQVLAAYGERVRAFRISSRGPASARNFGAARSHGRYIAFLDADDVWEPRKLELQLARFATEPGLGFAHCAVRLFGGDGAGELLEGLEGWVAAELLLLRRTVVPGPGSSMLIPRVVFDEVGGFDETLRASEDWDLCYRIASRSPIGYVAEPLVNYRSHAGGLHREAASLEYGMSRAFAKAFATGGPEVQSLRRRAFGRLHRILSGAYLDVGEPRKAVQHALRSIWFQPETLFPILLAAARRALR